ncbi:MAG: hypothetical protein JNK14_06565 [Chitinophagaceae bacterium]|nr:hypothetical protein [Chitinophagaceae bacterium]
MKHLFILVITAGIFCSAQSQSVTSKDFQTVAGSWTGELTYLDYTSNKKESIKTSLAIKKKSEDHFEMDFSYPGESGHGGKDHYRIKANGTMINDMKVIERSVQPDGSVKVVLEEKGKDGNDSRSATFHHLLVLGKNQFTITKLVKFDGEGDFFQRNQFVFNR